MWTEGLSRWYRRHGRHDLPWRQSTEPWAVLVSEVMLQQTSVTRVLPRWRRFLDRWPTPADCAAASLDDVLREWQGLGYPRRARALWMTAQRVTVTGWPLDESGLLTLPGVGRYTARALLAFSELGDGLATAAVAVPQDVNVVRVSARAALGRDLHEVHSNALDDVLRDGRPHSMSVREYTYALFDVGALRCKVVPRCGECPLHRRCAYARTGVARHRRPQLRQPPYDGSSRQLRGWILQASLQEPRLREAELVESVVHARGTDRDRVTAAVRSLIDDGLLTLATRADS